MHRLLARQLRKSFGLGKQQDVAAFIEDLTNDLNTLRRQSNKPPLDVIDLFNRIDSTYQQHERDLTLSDRSLTLSSEELSRANQRLHKESQQQRETFNELKAVADALLVAAGKSELEDNITSVKALSELLLQLATDKQTAQFELQQQQNAINEHAIVSITDYDGNITYANAKFCAISGYSIEELLGKNHRLINSGQHPESFFTNMWETIKSGNIWNGEIRNINKAQEYYWVSATIVPIFDKAKNTYNFIAIRTDITHQKQLEEVLSESRNFYQSITDNIGLGVYAVNQRGQITFLNPEGQRELGWSLSELSELVFHDAVHYESFSGNRVDAHDCPVNKSIQRKEIYRSEEDYFKRKNGEIFPISITAVPLLDESGNVNGHVGVFSDVSERKRAEAELTKARFIAENANKAKGDFLANMSHEIRTPMNAILGLTHLALKTPLNSQQKDYIEKANASATSLLQIINDILDYSKIEAGKIELEHRPFTLRNLLERQIQLFQDQAITKGLAFLFEISVNIDQPIIGDEGRVNQILVNLIGNAIKFTESGFIKLGVGFQSYTPEETTYQITIADSGIGMTAEQQLHLFESFTQADASISRKFGGTGLGMAISQRLIGQMGGSIEATSALGVGTTFNITLGFQNGDNTSPEVKGRETLNGHTCLVAEINTPSQAISSHILNYLTAQGVHVCHLMEHEQHKSSPDSLFDISSPTSFEHAFIMVGECNENAAKQIKALKQTYGLNPKQVSIIANRTREELAQWAKFNHLSTLQQLNLPLLPEQLYNPLLIGEEVTAVDHNNILSVQDVQMLQRRLGQKRILIVEGDAITQQVLLSQLNDVCDHVTACSDGPSGLALCQEQHFDLIIIDCLVSGLNGWEIIRTLRNKLILDIPIITLTSQSSSQAVAQSLSAGANKHLTKPCSKELLYDTIDDFLSVEENIDIALDLPSDDATVNYYQSYLQQYRPIFDQTANILHDLNSPQQRTSIRQMLKDSSAIGAQKLVAALTKLLIAQRLNQFSLDDMYPLIQSTLAQLQRQLVTSIVNSQQDNATNDSSLDSAQLKQLIDMLENYDAQAIDLIGQMYDVNNGTDQALLLGQARKLVAKYDFESALELLMPLISDNE